MAISTCCWIQMNIQKQWQSNLILYNSLLKNIKGAAVTTYGKFLKVLVTQLFLESLKHWYCVYLQMFLLPIFSRIPQIRPNSVLLKGHFHILGGHSLSTSKKQHSEFSKVIDESVWVPFNSLSLLCSEQKV